LHHQDQGKQVEVFAEQVLAEDARQDKDDHEVEDRVQPLRRQVERAIAHDAMNAGSCLGRLGWPGAGCGFRQVHTRVPLGGMEGYSM
jgi:hypothetical protein